MKQEMVESVVQESKDSTPNIAMADSFMKIFGFHRTSPTDEELKEKYKEDKLK